eukprot:1999685-Amphidinium_carterae.1
MSAHSYTRQPSGQGSQCDHHRVCQHDGEPRHHALASPSSIRSAVFGCAPKNSTSPVRSSKTAAWSSIPPFTASLMT